MYKSTENYSKNIGFSKEKLLNMNDEAHIYYSAIITNQYTTS